MFSPLVGDEIQRRFQAYSVKRSINRVLPAYSTNSQGLDTAIANIIAATPNDSTDNSSAESIYENLPRAKLEAPEFTDILAAHQSNYDY